MARLLMDAVGNMTLDDAEKYFTSWSADLSARFKLLDLAEGVYSGPGMSAENQAVASLLHAADYLEDRIAYEMNPHPKGMIRFAQPKEGA